MKLNKILNLHSFSDWTWHLHPDPGWSQSIYELSEDHYTSAPSSLYTKIQHLTEQMFGAMLCNLSPTLNLKEGRIITWVYTPAYPHNLDAYAIYGATSASPGEHQRSPLEVALDAWCKRRVTWWDSYDIENNPKLATRLDKWDGEDWIDGTIVYKDRLTGDNNRCGIGLLAGVGNAMYYYFDDTEIWI